MYILGIESSCDDTCAAVVKDGRKLLSNCVASSAAEQNLYGGVVPEIASRRHIEHISQVARAALDEAGTALEDRKSTRLNSSHPSSSRMPSSA